MHVRKLSLMNYRNYQRCILDLESGATIFHGDNGQGKTNLLEAIYLLATSRSFRTSTDRELMSWRAIKERMMFTRVDARVVRQDSELHLEITLKGEATAQHDREDGLTVSKTLSVNGLPVRASQLVGQLNAVIFSPEDLALLTGTPSVRRRYLDLTRSQIHHSYLRALQRYQRVLTQRNHLLRQIRERRRPSSDLFVWDEELMNLGAEIIKGRLDLITALNGPLADLYRRLTRSERQLELRYVGTSGLQHGAITLEEIRAGIRTRLSQLQPREIEQAVSLVGPHRDNVEFLVDGIDMGAFGSRGEQRIVVVALKLAEAQVIRNEVGESPVLLLDDILSELDPWRRQFVQEQVFGDFQTILTVADLSACNDLVLAGARKFQVQRGTLEEG
jgi:DNA replication and repair protein RecF